MIALKQPRDRKADDLALASGEDQGRGPTSTGEPALPIARYSRYAPEEQSGDQRSGVLPLESPLHRPRGRLENRPGGFRQAGSRTRN